MTDNKIIKALECCMFITPDKNCDECPKCNDGERCSVDLHRHTLELINRQKAEIERLEKHTKEVIENCRVFTKANDEANNKRFLEAIEVVKSEAIKEFAERLKNIYISDKRYDRPNAHTLVDKLFDNVDNLVKEMTENDFKE